MAKRALGEFADLNDAAGMHTRLMVSVGSALFFLVPLQTGFAWRDRPAT
ncbi:hypothetical protein [Paraburkholderia fynbosensis]|nr:hypothetical protein [Paraburkholderia fynbosensis]